MRIRDRIASGLGSVLEWYDFALYGFLAPLIAQLYFPSQTQGVGLLKAFSAFAIGFFARPVGALLFGSISDKYGRTVSLKMTPVLITIPTLLFALLPTYEHIGIWAPITLVFLRIFQGICIGGEYANNIVYLCESVNPKRLYFMGSIGSCTGSLGIFIASSVAAICYLIFPNTALLAWGWRVAFAISLPIGLITYLLRKNMLETGVFQQLSFNNSTAKKPIIDSFKHQWGDYVIAFGLTFLPATGFYYIFMFLPNFLSTSLGYNSSKILGDNSLSLLIRILIIPIVGLTADKIGGIKIARTAAILFLLFSYPLLFGIIHYPTLIPYFVFTFAALTTLNAGTTPGLLINLLNPKTRCTILSLTFNFCFGVFGGIVPVISLYLVDSTGDKMASIYYLIFAALISFIATFFFRKGDKHG